MKSDQSKEVLSKLSEALFKKQELIGKMMMEEFDRLDEIYHSNLEEKKPDTLYVVSIIMDSILRSIGDLEELRSREKDVNAKLAKLENGIEEK